MGADDFSLTPNEVIVLEPKFNNIITQTESQKKAYYNLSTTSVDQYQLIFKVLPTTTDFNTLLTHYNGRYGGYDSFAWTTVPSHIGSGSNITGRWVDGSLKFRNVGNKFIYAEVIFEKDNG